jgi:hypothetical protein
MPKVWTQTTALIRLLVTVYCEQKLKHLLGKREKQEHKVMCQLVLGEVWLRFVRAS